MRGLDGPHQRIWGRGDLPKEKQQTNVMAFSDAGSSRSGYDCDAAAPLPPRSIQCPICLQHLRNPHVISCCGNEFCEACIQRVKRDGRPCPVCQEPDFTTFLHKKLTREVNSMIIYCKHREKGCDWKGERRHLKAHLNPERAQGGSAPLQKGCDYQSVACTYCGERLQRRNIREHEVDICPKRPVEAKLESFKRMTEKENRRLQQELSSIKESHKKEIRMIKHAHERAFSEVQWAHQQLSQVYQRKLDEMKTSYEKLISEQKHVYQQQKEELGKLRDIQQYHKVQIDELTKLKQELRQMNDRFVRVQAQVQAPCTCGELIAQQRAALATQNLTIASLKAHTTPLTLTPFYFIVVNLDHYQVNNYMFNSEPFYSHAGGYKMLVTIYPNGVGERKNTHVSVYVGILRGEFDNQLRWPFSGSVTIEAYNRTLEQWSNRTEIVLTPLECDLRVVSRRVDILVDGKKGYQDFLPLDKFKNDYVKSTNTARFRVLHVMVYS